MKLVARSGLVWKSLLDTKRNARLVSFGIGKPGLMAKPVERLAKGGDCFLTLVR